MGLTMIIVRSKNFDCVWSKLSDRFPLVLFGKLITARNCENTEHISLPKFIT